MQTRHILSLGALTYIRNVESANQSQVSHCSIVRQHCKIEPSYIIVDGIWSDDSPEIEEVGVDIFDFRPDSLEYLCFHRVAT